jgi:peptidoglycan hydrolase-like protein with peptidoglycan-binding domain
MKKVILVTGVAVLALASVTSAAFMTNLTVGSRGADVTALQNWLITNGFSIPAGATGYFGSQTKAALVSYQKSVGLPAYGFFGPLTQAKLNGAAGLPSVGSNTAPVGQGGTVASVGTPGVAGTLAVSLWTTPSGVTAYKGQSYDLAGYKLQASASDMAVTSLSFDFDSRFWLYASALTVKDENGKVVGQVNNLNASNFTELTVGSDYRVNVPVSGLVVKATQAKYLTLNATFLAVTDRVSMPSLNVTQAQVRAVDGTGVTDTETVSAARSFSYQSTNIGQLIVTLDPSSPVAQPVQVSTVAQTQNVPLAVYSIKSQNQPATLQSLTVGLSISSTTLPVGNLLANVQLKAAGLTYSASILSATSATFTNLSIPLAADQYVPLSVTATLAQDTNANYDNVYITTSLNSTTGVSAIDATYNTITANSVTLTSNAQSFTSSGVTIAGLNTATAGAVANSNGASSTQNFTFTYSLTAINNPLYVSATSTNAVTAATTGTVGTISLISFRDNDSTNDVANAYFYVAPGQTKTFTVAYKSTGLPGTVAGTYSLTALKYGTGYANSAITGTSTLAASTIGSNLISNLSY